MTISTILSEDERFARALQQEEQDEEMARNLQAQIERESELASGARNPHYNATAVTTPTITTPTVPTNDYEYEDAAVAQALEQEMNDEDYARQLALQEEAALRNNNNQHAGPPISKTRRVCTTAVPCLIIGVGIAVLYYFMRSENSSGGNGGINIPGLAPFLRDNDPFDGLEPGEVAKWRNRGNSGLELKVLNALEPHWQAEFDQVIQDWNQSKALLLTVETTSPDSECEAVNGISKVCNGNYGATDWKGINMAVLNFGYIEASISQMNEYYLSEELNRVDEAQKRYTLCHEIGHSFGLPHTDENFFNKDLGNCMDYTSNPAANQQPDETNFQFLQELYGILPSQQSSSTTNSGNDNNDRNRRLSSHIKNNDIPQFVHDAMKQVSKHHHHRILQHADSHKTDTYNIPLQQGWSLQVQMFI